MNFDVEAILDLQQRGMTARVLGVSEGANPVLPHLWQAKSQVEKEGWRLKAEAWFFGWRIEDASRRLARLVEQPRRYESREVFSKPPFLTC